MWVWACKQQRRQYVLPLCGVHGWGCLSLIGFGLEAPGRVGVLISSGSNSSSNIWCCGSGAPCRLSVLSAVVEFA
jgi:hypothetical protein